MCQNYEIVIMNYSAMTKTMFKAALVLHFVDTEPKQHQNNHHTPSDCSPEHLPQPSPSASGPDHHGDAGPRQHPAVNSAAMDYKRKLQHEWGYFRHYSDW